MDDHVQQNLKEAQQSQRRFEFYFVALTFTILALSVRTSPDSVVLVTGIAELTGWLLLGVAGGIGLYRLSQMANVYSQAARKERMRSQIQELMDMESNGVEAVRAPDPLEPDNVDSIKARPTTRVRQKLEIGYNVWKEGIEEDQETHSRLFVLQQVLFGGGLTSLMVSRGWGMAKTTWDLLWQAL